MGYRVKEIFYTLQGEGANSGKAVVLCRFEGCNLNCDFCDTDYLGIEGAGGGEFDSTDALAEAVCSEWPREDIGPRVLCTGGEPLLQLDSKLTAAFHRKGIEVLLETNGTLEPPDGIDWICVSPKEGREPVIRKGDELKLAFPQAGVDPAVYLSLDFDHFFLQPIWGLELESNLRSAIEYCLKNPEWALSLQIHKYIGVP
jgi:7-carboxy-7-deazaguanine synthase